MKLNVRYIQLLMEAIIPLAGFFFWDWNLYFILLFYFIDVLAGEVIVHLKSNKIIQYNGKGNKERLRSAVISFVLLIGAFSMIHMAMYYIAPGINFKEEFVAFWTYEEMGLQQGFLLVPLVAFASYQQYKMEFLMPARFRTVNINVLWKSHIRAMLIMLGFAGVCLGVAQFLQLPEIVYVIGIVLFSGLYSLLLKD